jgi:hypothetical protein
MLSQDRPILDPMEFHQNKGLMNRAIAMNCRKPVQLRKISESFTNEVQIAWA